MKANEPLGMLEPMAYHGDNGWGADFAHRDTLTAYAFDYNVPDGDDPNLVAVEFTKKHQNSNNRSLRIHTANGVDVFLDRDGIENLKLFLG